MTALIYPATNYVNIAFTALVRLAPGRLDEVPGLSGPAFLAAVLMEDFPCKQTPHWHRPGASATG